MRKSILALALIEAAIAGCSEGPRTEVAVPAASHAAAPKVNVLEGAAVDAPIAGLAGAVWLTRTTPVTSPATRTRVNIIPALRRVMTRRGMRWYHPA